jgi:hypothetical protein
MTPGNVKPDRSRPAGGHLVTIYSETSLYYRGHQSFLTCYFRASSSAYCQWHWLNMLFRRQMGQMDGKMLLERPKVCLMGCAANETSLGQPNDFGGKARHHPAKCLGSSCRTDHPTRIWWTHLCRWIRGYPRFPFRLGLRCRLELQVTGHSLTAWVDI